MTERQARIVMRRHYGLDRPVTSEELRAEVEALRRRVTSGLGLDDRQERLAAALWPYAGPYIAGHTATQEGA